MQQNLSNSSGGSLAEMAHRDLDAALQLLADRAQYITGATGAAIALRRSGRNDMLCRASTGSNAPELGALLSAEYGLSGESVRTRLPLRCDDAERDARVNREVCRKLGIASVVVMPVVNDDEVLGVFELFSGKANAFGERDLSAVQRLSEMVETAVRLARATEGLQKQLRTVDEPAVEGSEAKAIADDILEVDVVEPEPLAKLEAVTTKVQSASIHAAEVVEREIETAALPSISSAWAGPAENSIQAPVPDTLAALAPTAKPEPISPSHKPLFWSAAQSAGTESEPAEADQSNVPPVLRSLKKCEVCGFPITAGRSLCVECEEKRWRGQLRRPSTLDGMRMDRMTTDRVPAKGPVTAVKVAGAASAAAAPAKAVTPAPASSRVQQAVLPRQSDAPPITARTAAISAPPVGADKGAASERSLVFSAGLEPEQSWLGRNKFVIIVLAVVATAVAYFLLR